MQPPYTATKEILPLLDRLMSMNCPHCCFWWQLWWQVGRREQGFEGQR